MCFVVLHLKINKLMLWLTPPKFADTGLMEEYVVVIGIRKEVKKRKGSVEDDTKAEELAHVTVKAEKSRDLLSASWSPGKLVA